MSKVLLVLLGLIFSLNRLMAQDVAWTSFDNLNDSLRIQKKPLLIFIYTDWCKYCKMQENSTFQNQEMVQLLNEQFYCLKLNAEENREISFLGRKYGFLLTGVESGQHTLAELLGKEQGTLIFPTTVLLGRNLQVSARFQGFLSKNALKELLKKFMADF